MNPIGNPARMQSILLANALAGKGYSPDTSKAILATPGMPKGAAALQASAVPMQQQPAEQPMAAPEQEPQAPAGPQYDQDIARALMAPDFSPAPTSFSALARVLGAGIGTYQDTKNRQAESANADYERQMLARTLAGLPPELQAYGKVDPKGALALQAQAAMRPPEKPTAPREQTVTMPGGDFGNLQVRQQEQNGRWVDQAIMGREPETPADRKTVTQNGIVYWADTGEPVLKNVAPPAEKPALDSKDILAQGNTLRDDYTRQSADYTERERSFQTLMDAATSNNPSGDLAMIYAFMKINDPGGRVTDSDYDVATRQGGWARMVERWLTMAASGRLDPETRSAMMNASREIMAGAQRGQLQTDLDFSDRTARQIGADRVGDVLPNRTYSTPPPILRFDAQGNRLP
jgi:hypothetical protein